MSNFNESSRATSLPAARGSRRAGRCFALNKTRHFVAQRELRPPVFAAGRLPLVLLCAVLALGFLPVAPAQDQPVGARDIRQLVSKHLTLLTDLPPSADVDALPELFDQAFPQWCEYFGVDPVKHAGWHVRACLMRMPERFAAAGLLPASVPEFRSGYALGDAVWCRDQASPYYRRHLLLHEGTHAFMHALVGGVGSPWYAEGIAELLATHSLVDGRLTLNVFPKSRDDFSKWGRIEIVATETAAGRAMNLPRVMAYDPKVDGENEWYGWCWALAAMLDHDPRTRDHFRQVPKLVESPHFDADVAKLFGADWSRVAADWQAFSATIDYGYDFARMRVDFAPGRSLAKDGAQVQVAADRGWQSSGVKLEAGKSYRVRAQGRFQVAREPRVWWSEPGGVTIRYYRGQPLGILLGVVYSGDAQANATNDWAAPQPLGLGGVIKPDRSGTLYLRVNDAPDSLADNAGSVDVEITAP
jgi:hypothetical protein